MPAKRSRSERVPDAFDTIAIMFKSGAPLAHCLVSLAPVPGRKRHIERFALFRHQVLRTKSRIIDLMRSRNRQALGDRDFPLNTTQHIRRAWLQPDRKTLVQNMALEAGQLLELVQSAEDVSTRLAFNAALRELGKEGLIMDAPSAGPLGGDALILVHRSRYPVYPVDAIARLLPEVDYQKKYHEHRDKTTKGIDRTYKMD